MSLTILTQPISFTPVYNQQTFVLTSDNYTLPNFKYKIELYIKGVLANTSYSFPRPNGQCIFDVSKIVQQYAYPTPINPTLAEFTVSLTGETTSYSVTFTETFDFPDVIKDTTDSNLIFVWLAAANWESGKLLSGYVNNFLPILGYPSMMLGPKNYAIQSFNTAALAGPKDTYSIYPTDKRTVSIVARNYAGTYKVDRLNVVSYLKTPVGTTLTKLFQKNLTVSTTTASQNMIYHQPVGLTELNTIAWDAVTVPAGRSNTISADEDNYYFVWFSNFNPLDLQPRHDTHIPIGFKIETGSRYERYTVLYQSANGGWWYIGMNLKNYRDENIKQTTMGTYLPHDYGYTDAVNKITSIDAQGSYELNTDWIHNRFEVSEIMDMLKSPNVFLINGANEYIPVIVKASSYKVGNTEQDKLVSYTITFNEAYTKNITI